MKIRPITKEADDFHRIQAAIIEMIKSSNITLEGIYKSTGMSRANFYKKLKKKNFTVTQLCQMLEFVFMNQGFFYWKDEE